MRSGAQVFQITRMKPFASFDAVSAPPAFPVNLAVLRVRPTLARRGATEGNPRLIEKGLCVWHSIGYGVGRVTLLSLLPILIASSVAFERVNHPFGCAMLAIIQNGITVVS